MDIIPKILMLPPRCMVNRKITKAFFKRNFDLKPSEKRLLDDFSLVTAIEWIASINPANANINSWEDDTLRFEEVQIIALQTSDDGLNKHYTRIAELIQRYIPYPILLFIHNSKSFIVNAADKRINLASRSTLLAEKMFYSGQVDPSACVEQQQSFLDSLTFPKLNKLNLKLLYESYIHRIISVQGAVIKGSYKLYDPLQARQNHAHFEKIAILDKEILFLQNEIHGESQLNTQVQLNLRIQALRKEIQHIKSLITS